jgi:nicotinamidase-related amidase
MKTLQRASLIPIDMQRGFDLPPWSPMSEPNLDAHGRQLLAAWRRKGWPVIHVRHDSISVSSNLRPGKPGHAFRKGFEPLEGEAVIGKTVNAAFIGTDLDLRLRRLGIDTVVLFGMTADMCVSTTARVASNLGYRTLVVADACAAFDLPDESGVPIPARDIARAHLATLRAEFAETPTTAELTGTLS